MVTSFLHGFVLKNMLIFVVGVFSGELASPFRLRRTDVVHELADDLSGLSDRNRDVLARLKTGIRSFLDRITL